MKQEGLAGTIKLFGTPAEETGVGKIYMARDGVFQGLDVVLEWHPGRKTKVTNVAGLALNNFEVEFFGQAAHGAADPWNGRSALDGVELMNHAVNMMREHMKPTARVHYVIPDGGGAPNVVPEYARVWYFVRDVDREGVEDYYQRILKIAEGAALATGTSHKVNFITGLNQYNLNKPLLALIHKNLTAVGPPEFTDAEQEWARELQKFLGTEEIGFHTEIEALDAPPPEGTGSTDVADVSFIVPTAGFGVATAPQKVPWHSWATTASHGTEAGFKGAVVATKVLVLPAIDLYTDPELLKEAQIYFEQQTEGKPYKSPLPEGQKVKLPD